jgi:hypothetical protein
MWITGVKVTKIDQSPSKDCLDWYIVVKRNIKPFLHLLQFTSRAHRIVFYKIDSGYC